MSDKEFELLWAFLDPYNNKKGDLK